MAGKYVAVACDMYAERPQIGKVLKIMDSDFELVYIYHYTMYEPHITPLSSFEII